MIEVGDKVICTASEWPISWPKVPQLDSVYTVRCTEIQVGTARNFIALEEIPFDRPMENAGDDYWFVVDHFRKANRRLDFTDVMMPKVVWE